VRGKSAAAASAGVGVFPNLLFLKMLLVMVTVEVRAPYIAPPRVARLDKKLQSMNVALSKTSWMCHLLDCDHDGWCKSTKQEN
jgi:hypothetical protein